ncbi:unnamed protein product [Bursaphelenchus xylophilus]|uniref:(pine wood nematode) hypothetical protein n=1 Tax=Bursaphelenchus xylophilus TaxID=6326 RepID=A0A1I7SUQ4_BURXY|nr:unnamed protein product [Bursaphelenchus xylophilus]CAG9125954.1 unnamed protein product [Bursaphelenchus xylophilus]
MAFDDYKCCCNTHVHVLLIAANIWWCVELFTLGNQVMNGKYYTFFGETYKYDKGWGIYFIVLGCIGVLYILLNIYFTYIAFKAYRYMVNVLNTHAHHIDAVMVSTHQTAYPPASVNPGFAPYPQTAPVESFSPSYPQPYPPGQAYPAHTYPDPNLPAGVPGRGFQVPSSVYPDIKSDNANEHM